MATTGEQWLARVFRAAVAGAERARAEGAIPVVTVDPLRVLGGRLAAQVEALADTGVLTEEQERDALDALARSGIMPEVRSASASASASAGATTGTRKPAELPRLRGVLAGPRELGRLDGRPVTLVSAELWSDRLVVDFYTDPGPDFRDRQAQATREHLEWMRRQRHGHADERPPSPHAGSRLQDLTWSLRDEHGTDYYRTGGSAESREYVDRHRQQWSPAPNGQRLTLLATDTAGAVILSAEIPIPGTAETS